MTMKTAITICLLLSFGAFAKTKRGVTTNKGSTCKVALYKGSDGLIYDQVTQKCNTQIGGRTCTCSGTWCKIAEAGMAPQPGTMTDATEAVPKTPPKTPEN
jgi:hypothetical protein